MSSGSGLFMVLRASEHTGRGGIPERSTPTDWSRFRLGNFIIHALPRCRQSVFCGLSPSSIVISAQESIGVTAVGKNLDVAVKEHAHRVTDVWAVRQ